MRAIVDEGGALHVVDRPDPLPARGEALLEVKAAALNRADLAQRAGRYAPPPGVSEILGLEAAGTIRSGGGSAFPDGSRACALLAGGGYAELVAVPRELLMPIPVGWSFEEAASFPEVFFTAYLNLFLEAGLRAGERVLVHAGASGVGTAAIQLAREAGCTVYATAGGEAKLETCRRLGAAVAVNYRSEPFEEVLARRLREEGADGLDVILDVAGASRLDANLGLLATGGRMQVIATLGGSDGSIDLTRLMRKRLTLRGSTLRSRSVEEKAQVRSGLMSRFWPAMEAGAVRPVIDSVFAFEDAELAHERMKRNENIGKIVLVWQGRTWRASR